MPTLSVTNREDVQAIGQEIEKNAVYEETLSNSVSLESAQPLFEKRNGRTYHNFAKDRAYVLPNDEAERDRLDMQFWAIHEVFDHQYHFASIGDSPRRILDIATGTGTWAIDMGDHYPNATVIGTDLSPIQPLWVPPNVSFELHDCLQYPWQFQDRFDFIHTQTINGFAVKDWKQFYAECYQKLSPGGWVESHEVDVAIRTDDDSLPANSAIDRWIQLWRRGAGDAFTKNGDGFAVDMRAAGFVDIVVKQYKLPIGAWMEGLANSGILSLNAITDHMEGISARVFMEKLGMTNEDMLSITEPAMLEWKDTSIHTYWPL